MDTNVVSEVTKARPHPSVIAWIDAQEFTLLFICTPVLAELYYGLERLPHSARQLRLKTWVDTLQTDLYTDRILPLDMAAAKEFGRVTAIREKIGRRMEPMDALIAAIALANRMALATRDTDDFADLGLDLINPFADAALTQSPPR
ncbi:MAG: PIN domain-containing protein [Xanthobacteraceae bacterium]